MSQEEIVRFVQTNLKGKRPTDVVREHLKNLETLANCFLRPITSFKPPNMVVYNCESIKCPFRLSFNKCGKQNLCLTSYQLVHDHIAQKAVDYDHKCLIRLISEKTEKIYEEHFIAEINKEENKIIFKRPCLIADALKKDHEFDINALTEDPLQRVKLKKKLDNIIHVLRRTFRKEYPSMNCIEDEFVSLRASKNLPSTKVKHSSLHQRKLSIASQFSVNSYESQMCSSSPTAASSAEQGRFFNNLEQQSSSQEPFSPCHVSNASFSQSFPPQLNGSNIFKNHLSSESTNKFTLEQNNYNLPLNQRSINIQNFSPIKVSQPKMPTSQLSSNFKFSLSSQEGLSLNQNSSLPVSDQVSKRSQSDQINLFNQHSQNQLSSSTQMNTTLEKPSTYFNWLLSNRYYY